MEPEPRAKAWLETKGVKHDSRFRKLKSARFKKHLQDHHDGKAEGNSRNKVHRRRPSPSPSPRPVRKQKKSTSSGEEDGSLVVKGKGKTRASSANLDEASGSD
ncbi:hypothetical protein B0H19DRAFT_1083302 [Mycena capillaripes]|nr:hypothetical protein B0H19DRAFT_1083302 [Mycena capillaripes]